MQIDVKKLRNDLKNKYGTAMFGGFPMAIADLSKIERATDEELIQIALQQNINLEKYRV